LPADLAAGDRRYALNYRSNRADDDGVTVRVPSLAVGCPRRL
jgi:hypothetical protein